MALKDRSQLRLGLLGGGQLAWMLEMKSQCLGLVTKVLCPDSHEPAAQVNPNWVKGHAGKIEDLQSFSEQADVLTFESEFFESETVKKALVHFKGTLFPSTQVLALLQDRLPQKQSLIDSKLPTSPFIHSTEPAAVFEFFSKNKGLVAKKRRNGYDGYGTYILKTKMDLQKFVDANQSNLVDYIFEKLIPFEKEMALQVARSRKGDIQFFPMVITVQKQNKCFYVVGPEKTPPALANSLKKWLNKINYVGVMGVEFFKTSNGLIINEVAPRVHNTGHHTLDSCTVDQFTMHWLCALQDKLPKPELKAPAFLMLNLLGNSELPVGFPKEINGSLYWYRKSNRPGRKLGHINWVGKNKRALVLKALQHLKQWKL